MRSQILSLLVSCFLLFSCSEKTGTAYESLEWELEIVDSIQIQTLEGLELMGIHPEKDLFLFSVSASNTPMLLTNSNGEILHRFDVPKDAPTGFGGITSGGIFMGDTIVIQGPRGVYFYDLEFNFLKGLKRTYPPKGMIYSGFDHVRLADTYAGPALISFSGSPQTDFPPNRKEYYEGYNAMDLIPLSTEEFLPILPLHPESRFVKSGEAFNFISITFALSGSQLTFSHQNDTLLYDVDLLDPELTQKSVGIRFDNFVMKKGFPYGGQDDYSSPSDYAGQVSNIYKVGDVDLIKYYSGIKKENLPPTTLSREEFRKETNRMNPSKWIIRNSKNQFSQPKSSSPKYRISRVDSQGRIWAMQDVYSLEEEPEVVTVYQIKLVQK
ncbi:hypothetical protein [Algoriphagus sp.]|uniref:hypothetical protein n=1 Tax=Algoriphagus sp. TaxID=1872435 RepID=UPI00391BC37B